MKLKIYFLLFLSLPLWLNTYSQVTIGSNEDPNSGALLDLKEEDKIGANANRGLAMPRVVLTTKDKLYPMFPVGYDSSEDTKHIGLTVFHPEECTMQGKGIYVWETTGWTKLGKISGGLSLSQDYFDLPSGADARKLIAQTLDITWAGDPINWTKAASNNLTEVSFSGNLAPNPLVSSPTAMTLLPDAMTIDPDAPWQSKETELEFIDPDPICGQPKQVIINQTNYALKVNGQFTNSQIIYKTQGTTSFGVEGNAKWTTTISDPQSILTGILPAIGTETGYDIKDYPNQPLHNNAFEYSTSSAKKYNIASVTFKDTASPIRFNDITVSILNCNLDDGGDPTMVQWAESAGFPGVADPKISDADDTAKQIDTPHPATGIAWHRDQNGNIFFSAHFGYEDAPANTKERRWMIVNLAATSFAPAPRTGTDSQIKEALNTSPSTAVVYSTPLWCYPHEVDLTNPSFYNNIPRVGRLYNWAAATNKKGGNDGQATIDDGENIAGTPDKIQGICPNGWHLPSDSEWTDLEQEISSNTSKYSSIEDANVTIPIGGSSAMSEFTKRYRGTTHGQAMKDPCYVREGQYYAAKGASNIISTATPGGFFAMLIGYGEKGSSVPTGYAEKSYFWTASGDGTSGTAWYHGVTNDTTNGDKKNGDRVIRWSSGRPAYLSVRCKKD